MDSEALLDREGCKHKRSCKNIRSERKKGTAVNKGI